MELDWFTILLIFFFFVLPLLQQIFGKKRPPAELPPEDGLAELPPGEHGRRREPEEWEPWEDAEPAPVEQRAPRSAWEELGLDDLFREPAPPPREPAVEPPPAPPVPQPSAPARWDDPLAVDTEPARPREYAPGGKANEYAAPGKPNEYAPPPPRPIPPQPTPMIVSLEELTVDREAEQARNRRRYAEVEPPRARTPVKRLGPRQLRDPRVARQAIVLAEVLGKPRALRELRSED
jgi:periplasmic protein TonB